MWIDSIERRFIHTYRGQRRYLSERGRYTEPHPQRAFALPVGCLRWSYIDQARAIDTGFFLERKLPMNGVHVLPLPLGPWRSDAEVVAWLEQGRFQRDPFRTKAMDFIEQQDIYGYSGAWERSQGSRNRQGGCEFWTKTMFWYKELKAAERDKLVQRRPTYTTRQKRPAGASEPAQHAAS